MAQFGRPSSDTINVGPFTGVGATSPNLYQAIDETAASDADYIESPSNPAGTEQYGTLLSSMGDPALSTGHIVRYRYAKSGSAGRQINLTMRLLQGATEIASWTHTNISNVAATAAQTLTGTQADAITDYSDLRLRFDPTSSGGGAGRTARLFWAEMEVPNAAPPPARTGTGASSLPAPSSAGSGLVPYTGTGASATPAPLSTANGAQTYGGSGASAVSSPTSAGAGTLRHSGAGASSLISPSSAGTAAETFTGTGASAALSPMSGGAGAESYIAAGSSTIPAPTAEAVGTPPPRTGTGASTLPAVAAAGTGALSFTGAAESSAPAPGSSGSGAQTLNAAMSSTLGPPSSAGAGAETFTGSGASATATPSAQGAGEVAPPVFGTGASQIAAPTASGEGSWTDIPPAFGPASSTITAPVGGGTGIVASGLGLSELPAPASSAAGVLTFTAEMLASIPSPSSTMSGGLGYAAVGASSLAGPTSNASGERSDDINRRSGRINATVEHPGVRAGLVRHGGAGVRKAGVTGSVARIGEHHD